MVTEMARSPCSAFPRVIHGPQHNANRVARGDVNQQEYDQAGAKKGGHGEQQALKKIYSHVNSLVNGDIAHLGKSCTSDVPLMPQCDTGQGKGESFSPFPSMARDQSRIIL